MYIYIYIYIDIEKLPDARHKAQAWNMDKIL